MLLLDMAMCLAWDISADPAQEISTLIDRAISLHGINVGSKRDLEQLSRLIEVQQLSLADLIDKVFQFDNAADALENLATGGHMGKVVIEVA